MVNAGNRYAAIGGEPLRPLIGPPPNQQHLTFSQRQVQSPKDSHQKQNSHHQPLLLPLSEDATDDTSSITGGDLYASYCGRIG